MQIIKLILLPFLEIRVLLDILLQIQVMKNELYIYMLSSDRIFVTVCKEVLSKGLLLTGTATGQNARFMHYLLL